MAQPFGAASGIAAIAIVASGLVQQQPVFRGRTDLVEVRAVVIDAEGRPVGGLRLEDFQLYDRGTRREIALFSEVSFPRQEAAGTGYPREDVIDNYTSRSDRLVVLVVDDLHFQGKTPQVQAIVRRLVMELGDQTTFAVVTTSGQFGVEATRDRALLLKEIDAFADKFDPEGRRLDPRMQYGSGSDPPGPSFAGRQLDLGKFFGDMTQYRVLEDVARMIGRDDNRSKALIWISGGNNGPVARAPLSAGSSGDFYLQAMSGAIQALQKAGVPCYGVHTGDFSPALLKAIAEASGASVAESDDVEAGVQRIISEIDHHYLLGFYPGDSRAPPDSEYRTLEIRVSRPGLAVRSLPGYTIGRDRQAPRNKDPLVTLAAGVLPRTDLPLRVFAAQRLFSRSKTAVAVAIEASVDASRVQTGDRQFQDHLKFSILAVDRVRKRVVRHVSRQTDIRLRLGANLNQGNVLRYQVLETIDLSPGSYQLRISAMSSAQQSGGSVYVMVDVVDPRKTVLAIGGIALSASGHVPISGSAPSDAFPFGPTLDRTFDRSEQLRVYADLFRRDGRQVVTAQVTLLDRERSLERVTIVQSIRPHERDEVDTTLDLTDVPAGPYKLRVSVTNGVDRAEREVDLTIR